METLAADSSPLPINSTPSHAFQFFFDLNFSSISRSNGVFRSQDFRSGFRAQNFSTSVVQSLRYGAVLDMDRGWGQVYSHHFKQPFAMDDLRKGLSWYRKKCMEHHYIVDDGAGKEQLGPAGRVFRNGRPESSSDLRLYSVYEFPLRDHAASCGELSYLALPVFDFLHNRCVGVLDFL